MKYSWISLVAFLSLSLSLPLSATEKANESVPSLGQQLEQAIYTELTLGDYDKAENLYEAILKQELNNKGIAAEALARLVDCQQKQGKTDAARTNYQKLKTEFPKQLSWIKSAESVLGLNVFNEKDLTPVPWVDGEVLAYNKLAFNKSLDTYVFQVKKRLSKYSDNVDNAWSNELSTYSVSNSHQQYMRYITDEQTNHLIVSEIKTLHHKGRAFEVSNGKLTVKDLDQNTEFNLTKNDSEFDQGLVIDILRRLPLSNGYQTTLPLYQNIQAKIRVVATNEEIAVPAGKFNTLHLKIDFLANGASAAFAEAWLSNDERRYIVKYIQGDMRDELAAIMTDNIDAPRRHNDAKGFSLTLPPSWFAVNTDFVHPKNGNTQLQPLKAFESGADIKMLAMPHLDWDTVNIGMIVDELNSWDYSWLKSYKHREDSVEYFDVNGLKAVSIEADIVFNQFPMTFYRVAVANEPNVFLFSFMARTDRFDDKKPIFDSIINSMKF